ncbi:MAG TPA: hypothetical protein VFV19_18025 [Candidatus Polarisedimenticolaceae bacterium]|nr:hypothetical protein [Candidatus Polarisedimenticolaceae bacterium]
MANRPDEELILFFYGEHERPNEIERALAADPDLKRRYETLTRELSALDRLEVPDPRPGLEGRMWARVSAELQPKRRILSWRVWAAIGAAAAAIAVAAFLGGRAIGPEPNEADVTAKLKALPQAARERVLQAALADHLDTSQRLLLEVQNGDKPLEEERVWAASLLSENRLYRRAAERAGQRRVAAVLAEIEPILVRLAESPDALDRSGTQQEIERTDLLFKLRVTRNNLKETS